MSRSRARVVLAGSAESAGPTDRGGRQDRPAVVAVARAMRDAGHEVVYLGPAEDAARLAAAAVQEDADLLGLCLPDGSSLAQDVAAVLAGSAAAEIAVFAVGGVPGPADSAGSVRFPAGAPAADVAAWVSARMREQTPAEGPPPGA